MPVKEKPEENAVSTREISIDVNLHRKVKVKSAEKGVPMRLVVEAALKDWLAKEEARA